MSNMIQQRESGGAHHGHFFKLGQREEEEWIANDPPPTIFNGE
jgi:hypothetical protein